MSEAGSVRLWRLVKRDRIDEAWSGEGAFRFGGRWNSRGHRVVYASTSLALALLEILVHIDPTGPVPELSALSVSVPPSDLTHFKMPDPSVPVLHFPHSIHQTRDWGDGWLRAVEGPLLAVPSVIIPVEYNVLINPQHPSFATYQFDPPEKFTLDGRFEQAFAAGGSPT